MGIEKSSDEGENPHEYKRRHRRELDNLFRANGIIASQVAGSKEYDRGYTWNFEWCSEDPSKAKPACVAAVLHMMDKGSTFEEAFDYVYRGA